MSATGQHHTIRPLLSFDSAIDYVYDCRWSPKHPCVFAQVDGQGRLDFWNLAESAEVCVLTAGETTGTNSFSILTYI